MRPGRDKPQGRSQNKFKAALPVMLSAAKNPRVAQSGFFAALSMTGERSNQALSERPWSKPRPDKPG